MKKIIILSVLILALAVNALVSAQVPADLPAIDEAAAEPYLGTWFMDQMCEDGQCFSVSSFGLSAELELSADNTMTMIMGDEEPSISYWYMENDQAYMLSPAEDGYVPMELLIVEDGVLSIGDGSSSMTFVRDEGIMWGTGEVVKDAVFEDFEGEWFIESIRSGGMNIPATLFELHIILTIYEDGLTMVYLNDGEKTEEPALIPYELADGKIYASVPDMDSGEPKEYVFEYHAEDAVTASNAGSEDSDTDASIVFVREENLSEGMNLADMLSLGDSEAE